MIFSSKNLTRLVCATSLAVVAAGCLSSCNDRYELADKQPEWLGSSIYEYLQSNGNYTNVVRLIDDLGYKDVLARTGSKTLFVADDSAFTRFYRKNDWGVANYSQLSDAQKKSLLFGAMINNSCQVAYLSSTEGPKEGDCMRRQTAQSLFDSVPVLKPEQMPETPYWRYYIDNEKTIPCFTDMTTPPMIHFIEDFLTNRLITNDDCYFLFNKTTKRKSGDANVNGINMTEQNIKCSNGFIHKMGDVITSLPNMAQIINNKAQTSEYANLLNRFCAPYYAGDEATKEYNRLYNANVDSVFQKRYFSLRSQGGRSLELTPWEGPVNGTLKFDPGWNQFYSETSSGLSENTALQQNMGVMLVPSNSALSDYWNKGAGKVLKDYYGSWEKVPDKVVSKMLNVNMLNSFTGSVPSKFETVLNDANDEMGLDVKYVDSVFIACNGAVYLTNRVFNPVAYISVSFPALINETMNIFYWGIEQCGYDVYLNSQQSYYSLFIPNNKAMVQYIDPCSYGKSTTQLFKFRYDGTQLQENRVKASIWNYDVETGTVTDSIGEASYSQIKDRLEEILNTHIVIGNVEDGNEYYMTKGGTTIRVRNADKGQNGMTVQGSWQLDNNKECKVVNVYDESKEGNGKTYILDSEPIMSTRKSVADVLDSVPEYSEFYKLLEGSSFLETLHEVGSAKHGCASRNISFFNTFLYTVLVPKNEAIKELIANGELPTWEDVEAIEDDDSLKAVLTAEIEDFIRYHIVDNSFFIGQGSTSGKFETSSYSINGGELSYHKVDVNCSNDGLTVTDDCGYTRKVMTGNPKLYNRIAREWIYEESDATRASEIYTTSNAVVHLIDGVLRHK